jgi:hypothetical protein
MGWHTLPTYCTKFVSSCDQLDTFRLRYLMYPDCITCGTREMVRGNDDQPPESWIGYRAGVVPAASGALCVGGN